jgi:hypothetical protein
MAGDCVAVGDYVALESGIETEQPFAETLAGGVWTPSVVPLISLGDGGYLASISCAAVGDCVAVGEEGQELSQVPLIETETNGAWTASLAPIPGGLGSFSNVACPHVGDCVALGVAGVDANQSGASLVTDTEVDGTWTIAAAPMPTTIGSLPIDQWNGLSCPAIGTCEAVGDVDGVPAPCITPLGCGTPVALIDTLSDGSWSVADTPLPAASSVSLPYAQYSAISCAAVGSCMAVGNFVDTNDVERGFAEILAGDTWTSSQVPEMAGETTDQLYGVSCPSTSLGTCLTVGSASSSTVSPVVDTYAAGTWSQSLPPVPAGAYYQYLSEISCASPTHCVAVGDLDAGTGAEPMIDTLASGAWSAQLAMLPPDASTPSQRPFTRSELAAVDCSPADCVAIGTYSVGSVLGGNNPRNQYFEQGALLETLPVAPSTTYVRLSFVRHLRYGDEGQLAMRIQVSSPSGWLPVGEVVVMDRTRPVCAARLDGFGAATCAFTHNQLRTGRHVLTARYEASSGDFRDGSSVRQVLNVANSTTTLTGSTATMKRWRQSWSVALHARLVSHESGVALAGRVVRFWLGDSAKFTCSAVTDDRGVASCVIAGHGRARFNKYEVTFARSSPYLQSRTYGSIN